MIDTETYKRWYAAMDACNGGALLRDFAENVLPKIWEESRELGKGTDYVNGHPLVIILADKLLSLAHYPNLLDAYQIVRERSEKKDDEKSL